jgi:hypothetical protein
MNPSERQVIERILREQAAAADATGDLDFLGYTYPNVRESGPDLSPIPQVDAAGFPFVAAPIEPDRYEWAAAGGALHTNSEQITANVARALTKGITGRNPLDEAYDPDLTVGQALSELGVTGLNNIIGQVGFAVLEPGPFDLLPAFGALIGIPKVLQEMIAKRVHPSLIDWDGLPMQMYRGQRVVTPGRNTHVGPNYTSQLRGGHHTPDPYYAGDFTEIDHMPRGNYQIGANIRMESPAVSRVLEVRGTRPIQPGEAADLKRAIESLYGSSVSGETLSETLRYIDELEAAGRPFDLPEMDRIYAELDFDYKKRSPHRNAAVGPTRMDLLTTAGYEGYSDLGNIFEHEFLTFDPGRNLIRAYHPEDAIEWLSRRPDLSEKEMDLLQRLTEQYGAPQP